MTHQIFARAITRSSTTLQRSLLGAAAPIDEGHRRRTHVGFSGFRYNLRQVFQVTSKHLRLSVPATHVKLYK